MSEPINQNDLLQILLKQGWVKVDSEVPGMIQINKGKSKWFLNHDYMYGDLFRAVEHEALNRGLEAGS